MRPDGTSDLSDHLGYWLRLVSNAVSLNFARALENADVAVAEWVFLRLLFDAAPIAPSQLAQRMGMTKGAVSKLSERLIEKRLVKRLANPRDARAHTLALTPRGRALTPRLAEIADANDARFFGALAPGERERLRALLQKIALTHELTDIPVD